MNKIEWVCGGLIVIILAVLALIVWQDAKSEKIMLNKSEWICTKTETQVNNLIVGKVITPQIIQRCVKYEKLVN